MGPSFPHKKLVRVRFRILTHRNNQNSRIPESRLVDNGILRRATPWRETVGNNRRVHVKGSPLGVMDCLSRARARTALRCRQ
jgi:hypothetical protein